jgi:hypothetical protein
MSYSYADFQRDIINNEIKKSSSHIISNSDSSLVDWSKLPELLSKKWNDVSVLKVVTDLFNTELLTHAPGYNYTENIPYLNNTASNLLKDIKKVSSGAQGAALLSGFIDNPEMFIVKTTIGDEPEDNDNTLYEYFIGTRALNNLREYIPNFCYTFGLFRCEAFSKHKKICEKGGNINYVVYERIPGKTLGDFISNNLSRKLTGYILQIILALQVAYEKYGYTHYDLHYGNIMLRKLDKPTDLEYHVGGKKYVVLQTDAIATIIDYGFSHFQYGGVQFGGQQSFPELSINPTRASGGYDLHKLIGYTLYSLYTQYGKEAFTDYWADVYSYFKSDPFDIIKNWGNKDIEETLEDGAEKYMMLDSKYPEYYNEPIELLKHMLKIPITENYIKVYDTDLYRDDTTAKYRLSQMYNTVFNIPSTIVGGERNYKSWIINSYKKRLLQEYLTTPDLPVQITTKISRDISKLVLDPEYKTNDENAMTRYKIVLSSYLDEYDDVQDSSILKGASSINLDIKMLRDSLPLHRIANKYCKIYQQYAMLCYYANITPNGEFKSKYYIFRKFVKTRDRLISEWWFYTLFRLFPTPAKPQTSRFLSFLKENTIDKPQTSRFLSFLLKENTIVTPLNEYGEYQLEKLSNWITTQPSSKSVYAPSWTNQQIKYILQSCDHNAKLTSVFSAVLKKYVSVNCPIYRKLSGYNTSPIQEYDTEVYTSLKNYKLENIDTSGIAGNVGDYCKYIFERVPIPSDPKYIYIGKNDTDSKKVADYLGVSNRSVKINYLPEITEKFNICCIFEDLDTASVSLSGYMHNISSIVSSGGILVVKSVDCEDTDCIMVSCIEANLNRVLVQNKHPDLNITFATTTNKKNIESAMKPYFKLLHFIESSHNNPNGVFYAVFKRD